MDRDGRRRSLGIGAITCRRVAGRSSSAYGPLDRSRLVARTGRRLVARRGRRRGPEAAGPRGQSRPADLATHRTRGRVPEVAGPLSRPADRVHRGRSNVRDAVRSPGSSRNRYSHSAIPGRTPRVAAEGFARCQPRDLPAVRRHTGKTQPPRAEQVRHCTGEPRLALPEQRALGEAQQRRVASRHTGAVRPLEEDRRSRRPPHQKIKTVPIALAAPSAMKRTRASCSCSTANPNRVAHDRIFAFLMLKRGAVVGKSIVNSWLTRPSRARRLNRQGHNTGFATLSSRRCAVQRALEGALPIRRREVPWAPARLRSFAQSAPTWHDLLQSALVQRCASGRAKCTSPVPHRVDTRSGALRCANSRAKSRSSPAPIQGSARP